MARSEAWEIAKAVLWLGGVVALAGTLIALLIMAVRIGSDDAAGCGWNASARACAAERCEQAGGVLVGKSDWLCLDPDAVITP